MPGAEDEVLDTQRRHSGETAGAMEQNIRRAAEQQPIRYPVPGEYHLREVTVAELGPHGETAELTHAIFNAVAYGTGMEWGLYAPLVYDQGRLGEGGDRQEPADEHRERSKAGLTYLMGKYLSVEDALRRPNPYYLWEAIRGKLEGKYKELHDWLPGKNEVEIGDAAKARLREINKQLIFAGKAPHSGEAADTVLALLMEDEVTNETRLRVESRAMTWIFKTKEQFEALVIADAAFQQRELACEYPDGASQLLFRDQRGAPAVTPEVTHWEALFYGDFGARVDNALRAIARVAMPPDGQERRIDRDKGTHQVNKEVKDAGFDIPTTVYATNFDSSTALFAEWHRYIRQEAGGDELAAFTAWKIAKTFELPGQLGFAIETKGKRDKYVFADPSVGNAINPFLMFLREKQMVEWGLDANGNRIHADMYASYTGHPLFILGPQLYADNVKGVGEIKFRPPAEGYLQEARIKIPAEKLREVMGETLGNLEKNHPDQKVREQAKRIRRRGADVLEISLFDLWYYGRLPFGGRRNEEGQVRESFPWIETERTDQPGEVPKATFAGHRLRIFRAWEVIKNSIQKRTSINDLRDPTFFDSRLRNWGKVLGPLMTRKQAEAAKTKYVESWESPRVWWVASLIYQHFPEAAKSEFLRDPEVAYQLSIPTEYLEKAKEGGAAPNLTIKDVLANAGACGFIRPEDKDWILKNIGG